jgi:voltage-gated potassium channel Kch
VEGRGAQGIEDSLWWAITTVTTVGYGDIVPKTHIGRAVAVVVMVVGITFMSLLTANIASYLSRRNQEEFTDILAARIDALESHLAMIGEDVAALRAALLPADATMVGDDE